MVFLLPRRSLVDVILEDWLRISSLISVGRAEIIWRYLVASLLASFVFKGVMMVPSALDALVSSMWLCYVSARIIAYLCGGAVFQGFL